MKVGELLSVSAKILKTRHDCGIKADSYTYLPLYEDYKRLVSEGEKMTYIVAYLSEKYSVCERKVYKVLKQMNLNC